jgi:predicted dehydrogenase
LSLRIVQAYEGYEKLVEDPSVDIVYVGGINPLHYTVSKMALNNGKERVQFKTSD